MTVVFSDKSGSGHTLQWLDFPLRSQVAFMTAHFMCVCRVWEVTESHRESRTSSGEHSPSNTTLQTLSVAAVTSKVCPKKFYPSVFQNTLHILPSGVWSMPIRARLAHSVCSDTSRAPALAHVDPTLWPPSGSARLGWMAGVPCVRHIVKGLLRARSFNDWPSLHLIWIS